MSSISGIKHVYSVPDSAGSFLSMIQYDGTVLIATEFAVFQLTYDDGGQPIVTPVMLTPRMTENEE